MSVGVVQGIGVSAGSAFGPIVKVGAAVRPPADEPPAENGAAKVAEARE